MSDYTITRAQKQTFHFAIFDRDNQPDTTSVPIIASGSPSVATAQLAAGDNRAVVVTGQSPGGAGITVTLGIKTLTISVIVQDTPDLSHIDLVSADLPVSKF